ncbi:MAG: hypothetical protein ACI86L_002295 [Dokdonia sp.]|jgi:hypothetical protein
MFSSWDKYEFLTVRAFKSYNSTVRAKVGLAKVPGNVLPIRCYFASSVFLVSFFSILTASGLRSKRAI